MRSYAPVLAGLTLALGGGVLVASAQTYTPLAPLPIGEGGTTPTTYTLTSYLTGAIKLLIAVAGALAILMTIIAGTQYVAAGINPSAKSDAKSRIENALIGLVLVLTSYLLLRSIDPRLVEFNLVLPPVGGMSTSPSAITASPTPTAGEPWPSDSQVRSVLTAAGISVTGTRTPTACSQIGQSGCTSVYQLGQSAINGLISLKNACGCSVVVTGGTEYWNHSENTRHRPGNSVVDINKNATLDTKIKTGTSLGVQSSCSRLGPAWRFSGALYVDEGSHWHVCY